MKTKISNFLAMAIPKKKMGFSVFCFGQETENRYKNIFRFVTAMAGETTKKHPDPEPHLGLISVDRFMREETTVFMAWQVKIV